MGRRVTGVGLVSLLAVAAALVYSPSAGAEIDGPCQASVARRSVAGLDTGPRSEAIEVREKARVPVTMTATRPITHLTVELEFAGLRWTVHDDATEGSTWTRFVNVADYSKYGVGLYEVVATSDGQDFTCAGAALVDVQGTPLRTPAGIAGLAAAIVGAIAIVSLLFRRRASGAAPFVGAFFGLLLGAGVGVLLQQLSVLYPTVLVALLLLGGGGALGLLVGLGSRRAGRPY
jgi:hypothetical protein